ncbi:hypothetical protein GCM10022381_10060 [Leifsonia kafniensis]|uniref:Lipoprotein n=2 Tax=Leifsonia kafniensis TaxID=475957 RepID=A0ABP7K852_9MICO
MRNLGLPVLLAACVAVGVTGCAGPTGGTPGPILPSATGATVMPSAGPTDATTSPSTPTPTSTTATGCAPNGASIPAGADTATIEDVDGDGKPDVEYYSESPTFEYGIQTASGATISLADDLAGPGRHGGWSALLENETVITVLDDGRTATLHAFVDCGFVTTKGVDGNPYRFLLNGFGETGTGVECSDGNGGRQLIGVLAARDSSGNYGIVNTVVTVSGDGLLATNGTSSTVATGLPESDPQVVAAMGSSCGDIPKVQTSGM